MNYEEWINAIEVLLKKNDEELASKLINDEVSENIAKMLEPKIKELIKEKLKKNINDIVRSLDFILVDSNNLDLALNDFKKKIKFLYELIKIKVLTVEDKSELDSLIKEKTDDVYDILLNESRVADQYGIFESIVKNNRIKWS